MIRLPRLGRRVVRDAVSTVGPAVALAVMVAGPGVSVPVALALSGLLFAGLYLVLNPRTEADEGRLQLRAEAHARLEACQRAVARLRALALAARRAPVGERVLRICERVERVIGVLAGRELSLASATQLAAVFDVAARTFDTYVHMAHEGCAPLSGELRTVVEAVEGEGRLFDQLDAELAEWGARVLRDDLVEIEAAIRTLERTLTIEGLS